MPKAKGIDLRYEWEVREIRRTDRFTVVRHSGGDAPRLKIEVTSLDRALAEAHELGPDEYGHRPMIYAVTVGDLQSIHVDERHLRMLQGEEK